MSISCTALRSAILTSFFFPLGTLFALNFAWTERHCHACKTPRSMYMFIYNSFSVIRTTIAKNCHFYVLRPSFFVCLEDAPVAITQNVAWMKRQFSACQTPRSMYLSIFNSFPVIRCLSRCKSKSRYFYHIFVSSVDAPGAITLNVVWMEREFDAYKLSRCMCPSNYNHLWDRARYWSKIVIFFIPFCIRRPR